MNGKHKIFTIFLVIIFVLTFGTRSLYAAIKDSDVDGLSDEAEINIYHTNPQVFDTDGDGRGDGDEILDGTDPLNAEDSTIATLSRPDPGILGNPEKFFWYLGRASGILAFVILSGVVSFGLILSSRAFSGIIVGATAYEIHRFAAWLALTTVVVHFSSFFFDSFLRLKVFEALVPFAMSQNFQTVMGFNIGKVTALGIIAFYLVIILVLTSTFRSKMSPKLWRAIHYVAFIAYLLFVLHGFMTGTDSKEWWMRALYATSVSIVSLLVLVRIFVRNLVPAWRNLWKSKTDENDLLSRH